ncbi:Hsp70 family protein [Nocardia beijingensis]|uniref:Hsp70 family protein n=1 Tax=Nocardia beijingensis TaxID=95162 RepID=UPI0018941786|nr:Hsp70 family protein [Nocardia beijingensis]MBF6467190.1 Hsp70 family protein [Nocardia beijingensis]
MTTGLGFSIGAVNSVTASVSADRPRPAVRSRRTAVTFDSAGGLRLGGIPQFDMAVTDFADLGRDPEAVVVGGRIWSPANLVAAVVGELRATQPGASEAGVVTTYPAMYSDKQVALLRQALDLSGAGDVLLVPEPVAAAEWLEREQGPLETGFVLIYDLGGTSLDVSIVRVGPDWDDHPMIGKPMRSYDFGGRPLGSMIARYAPGVSSAGLSMTSIVDIDGLRTAHVQDSLQLVRDCVREAGVTLSAISRILLVGGASRPAEVARTLAELGRPVVISADPGQTIAAGAALMAARTMALGASDGRAAAPRVAVFSSAAVVSAVAMSAVTVFGGPTVPELSPLLERLPELGAPTDSLLVDVGDEQLADAWSWVTAPGTWHASRAALAQRTSAYTRFITPAPRSAGYGPSMTESRSGSHSDPRSCCAAGRMRYRGYGDPAYFVNPLPFAPVVRPVPGDVAQPPVPGQPSTPGLPLPGQAPDLPGRPASGTPGPNTPAPQNGSTPAQPDPASGANTPGGTAGNFSTGTPDSSGAGASSGASSSSSGDAVGPSEGSFGSGGASSGSTHDSAPNGTSDDSPGGSSAGGSTGNSSSHGSSPGGSAGNSSSHGSSSGGSNGNSSSHGSSSGGSAGESSADGSASGASVGSSSTSGSSSGGSTGNSSTHGSSSAGAAGNSSAGGSSSTGGSASAGRPGGASSAGNHSGGNSSGASSSGGSRGRSGSVGGSSAGGAGAGGGGGRGR